ncbi:hypothetical protein L6452_06249 [Arctium lappa]|uniref:Uncharacterized protein n=1 Tax=Arctium lappa TaxID=4217 RepID=A0ACB9EI09_ARCLA|nr:hypothetical protein L6452_06249 [Arctium lappa]
MNIGPSSGIDEALISIERSSVISNGQNSTAEGVYTLFEDSRDDRIVTGIDRDAHWPADVEDDRFISMGQTSLSYNNHHVSNKQDDKTFGARKSNVEVSQAT